MSLFDKLKNNGENTLGFVKEKMQELQEIAKEFTPKDGSNTNNSMIEQQMQEALKEIDGENEKK